MIKHYNIIHRYSIFFVDPTPVDQKVTICVTYCK